MKYFIKSLFKHVYLIETHSVIKYIYKIGPLSIGECRTYSISISKPFFLLFKGFFCDFLFLRAKQVLHLKDVFPLGEDVCHGAPHHVDQTLFVFLVELDVGTEKRRKSIERNPERHTPGTSLIHDAAVGVENAGK